MPPVRPTVLSGILRVFDICIGGRGIICDKILDGGARKDTIGWWLTGGSLERHDMPGADGPAPAVNREELYAALNRGILEERLRAFRRNLSRNLALIRARGGLAPLVEGLRGARIVVAGAGPSLDACLPALRKYCGRRGIAIIAADMALRPLVEAGVRPSFVMSCETRPVDYFRGIDHRGTRLLAFACISPSNLSQWKGEVSFYNWMVGGPEYEALWDLAGRDLGFLATGNLVTTQALSFALGCAPSSVLLAGNDLAFRERYYARGVEPLRAAVRASDRFVPAESREYGTIRRRRAYEVRRGGERFYTDAQFLAAKLWMEDLLARERADVFDCSEPGLSGRYVAKTSAEEYFADLDRVRERRRAR